MTSPGDVAVGIDVARQRLEVALTACLRKLLVLCNAVCQHRTLWDPTMA